MEDAVGAVDVGVEGSGEEVVRRGEVRLLHLRLLLLLLLSRAGEGWDGRCRQIDMNI